MKTQTPTALYGNILKKPSYTLLLIPRVLFPFLRRAKTQHSAEDTVPENSCSRERFLIKSKSSSST